MLGSNTYITNNAALERLLLKKLQVIILEAIFSRNPVSSIWRNSTFDTSFLGGIGSSKYANFPRERHRKASISKTTKEELLYHMLVYLPF